MSKFSVRMSLLPSKRAFSEASISASILVEPLPEERVYQFHHFGKYTSLLIY
jgi:hypothetical protein